MGSKNLRSLRDFIRHKFSVRVECQCGRVRLIDPRRLLDMVEERGWTAYSLDGIAMRLRCEKCGQRPKHMGPGFEGSAQRAPDPQRG